MNPVAVIPTIDSHHHLWDTSENEYPWLAGPSFDAHFGSSGDLPRPYLLEQYLEDTKNQNIVKSIHVEASFSPDNPVGETNWLQALADTHGFPHGIVAFANLDKPDVREVLEQHCAFANMRGIRMPTMTPAQLREAKGDIRSKMSQTDWRKGFKVLCDLDLSYDLQAPTPLMAEAAELASDFPEARIFLTHTGLPLDRTEEGMDAWRRGMKKMAERLNISVKITGLPMTDWNWTTASLRPMILETIDMFGVDRCMFGSNFPIDRLHSSFDTLFDAFREVVSDFSADEQAALFHDNAARGYRL
ncbi:UNVERIFIED_CONTAM: hypothetical protein GTU68_044084 [Idotea baltica]|nr:hypothetical protein [Idotea baltica]